MSLRFKLKKESPYNWRTERSKNGRRPSDGKLGSVGKKADGGKGPLGLRKRGQQTLEPSGKGEKKKSSKKKTTNVIGG